MQTSNFVLRVTPWFTDGCSTFLVNLLKWYPKLVNKPLKILEFGGGNSTFFFLQKGCRVISVESDLDYLGFIKKISSTMGYETTVFGNFKQFFDQGPTSGHSIIHATEIEEQNRIINLLDPDLIVNDGISRDRVAQMAFGSNSIVVTDNIEWAANWGKLGVSSAKSGHVKCYRRLLRSPEWRSYVFEQPQGREGRAASDKVGWEGPNRWISAVSFPITHLLNSLMVTHLGFPVVNQQGVDDEDLKSLGHRCPYDWDNKRWLKGPWPEELDLGLDREFD